MTARIPFFLSMASVLALTACGTSAPRASEPQAAAEPAALSASTLNDAEPVSSTTTVTNFAAAPENKDAAIYARLSRLEADMGTVKTQMNQVAPIIEKMPALQDKLGELVGELQRIDARVAAARADGDDAPMQVAAPMVGAKDHGLTEQKAPVAKIAAPKTVAEPVVDAPVPATKPVKEGATKEKVAAKKEPAAQEKKVDASAPTAITAVRVGDYSDKTRVVFDVSRKTPYTYDLDNSEKIMIVDVDAPALQTSPTAQFIKSPLVASYAAQSISGGKTRVVLQLRAPVKLITSQALPPNGEKTDRVVLDLAPVTP